MAFKPVLAHAIYVSSTLLASVKSVKYQLVSVCSIHTYFVCVGVVLAVDIVLKLLVFLFNAPF